MARIWGLLVERAFWVYFVVGGGGVEGAAPVSFISVNAYHPC